MTITRSSTDLVVERVRLGGHRHLGGAAVGAHRLDDAVLQGRDAVERQGAAHRHDEIDEPHLAHLAHAQPFQRHHAGNAQDGGADPVGRPAGAVSVSVSTVRRASRQPTMQMTTETAMAAAESAQA